MRMYKKAAIVFFILIIILIFFEKSIISKKAICKDCNIILIDIDCLRPDHLGIYGYPKNTTPYLDKFAEDSIVFKNFFVEGSMTTLTKMSVYTSLYPFVHGVKPAIDTGNSYGTKSLDSKFLTLPQILNKEGYTTTWIGPLYAGAIPMDYGFNRGFDYFIENSQGWEEGFKWIKNNKDNKFFLSFYSSKTHDPYTPSKKTLQKFTNKTGITFEELEGITIKSIIDKPSLVFQQEFIENNPELFLNKTNLKKFLPNIEEGLCSSYSNQHLRCSQLMTDIFFSMFDSDIELLKSLYDGEINKMDEGFGELIDILKEKNILNKTIIVFYSDHGEAFLEHGSYAHQGGDLYDEITHAPLMFFIPKLKKQENYALTQGVDIMPTLLELVGLSIPRQVQGKSLLSLINKKDNSIREFAYSESIDSCFSVRSKEWKYIKSLDQSEEFYNLKNDPYEKENLVNKNNRTISEIQQEIKMKEELKNHLNVK